MPSHFQSPAPGNKALLYGLDEDPPLPAKFLAAAQHLLAIFASIATAPLLICLGMGLDAATTSYMISSALIISGVATWVQVHTLGRIGSGLLSVQGTSFTFVGPLIFISQTLADTHSQDEILGVIFGCTLVGALMLMLLSHCLTFLQRVVTTTVTGTAVIMLGLSLVMVTINNLLSEYQRLAEAGQAAWQIAAYALGVISVITLLSTRRSPWWRLSSIAIGLGLGCVAAAVAGQLILPVGDRSSDVFYPVPFLYPPAFHWGVFLSLVPIYLVTAAESVGDLTATSNLSRLPVAGNSYWRRIRNGVLGDGFNSLLAAVFCTFPNTTFSQNNGVIRLTGVASRHVGAWLAGMLVLLGFFPVLGSLFMALPKGVLYGATGLMFALVAWSGLQIILNAEPGKRTWLICSLAMAGGLLAAQAPALLPNLSPTLAMLLGFPVSSTTFLAIFLELLIPRSSPEQEASSAS
ncbi:MAG: purine/pyrimidine permease [Halieaceae bacterium]|nr:purine/pyrimidine permease [Halieaceae bacterium]